MLRWVKQLTEEFFEQGDRERKLGLPVSPFTDRVEGTSKLPKLQTNFISLIAEPLVTTFNRAVPCPELVQNIRQNAEFWGTSPVIDINVTEAEQ